MEPWSGSPPYPFLSRKIIFFAMEGVFLENNVGRFGGAAFLSRKIIFLAFGGSEIA